MLHSKVDSRKESLRMLSNLFVSAADVYDKIPETFGDILSVNRIGKGIGKKRSIVNVPKELMQKYPKD